MHFCLLKKGQDTASPKNVKHEHYAVGIKVCTHPKKHNTKHLVEQKLAKIVSLKVKDIFTFFFSYRH